MSVFRSLVFFGTVVAALLAGNAGAISDGALRIDGGEELGWEEDSWYVQVDGVMGGKSSGQLEFLSENSVMRFTGDIILDGGGFSSVRRRIDLDLGEYAGVVVTLEADAREAEAASSSSPTGLHLQFGDGTSRFDFSSAFAVPLSSSTGDGDVVVSSVYLPIESFDRGSRGGWNCRGGCAFNPSEINGLSVYVLFQEGSFDVRLRSIQAVREPRSFSPPDYGDNLDSAETVVNLIRSTISSGGGLYDKSYVELCIAMYWSVLNTVLSSASSSVIPDPVRAVVCAGLQRVEDQMLGGGSSSKQDMAWTLRYAMDAAIADLEGSPRTTTQDWLPTPAEAASMEVGCEARTSPVPGYPHDPTNEIRLDGGNFTMLVASASIEGDDSIASSLLDQLTSGGAVATLRDHHGLLSIVAGISLVLGMAQLL